MGTYVSESAMLQALQAARQNYAKTRGTPVALISSESEFRVRKFGRVPEMTVSRTYYKRGRVSAYLLGRELAGEEGRGTYGVALYGSGIEILVNPETVMPRMFFGLSAAEAVAQSEAKLIDRSGLRTNESVILTHSLMEEPVLRALLGTLMRAEPGTSPARIGIRRGEVRLLLEDDEGPGASLSVPEEGYVCRDQAAGTILSTIEDEIACLVAYGTDERYAVCHA